MSYAIIKPKRGTASEWSTANPILALGEIAIEVPVEGIGCGTSRIKIGDGIQPWNTLPYAICPEGYSINIDLDDYATISSLTALEAEIDEVAEDVATNTANIASHATLIETAQDTANTAIANANTGVTNSTLAQTTANAAMPKSGGTATGLIKAMVNPNNASPQIRNIVVVAAGTNVSSLSVDVGTIILERKS